MAVCKHVQKTSVLHSDLCWKFFVSLGPFHIDVCALGCLGAMLESSGLDEALVEADLYSSVTSAQLFNGNHHLIALDAHQISLLVLLDLWIEALLEHSPALHKLLPVAMHNVREAGRNGRDKDQAHVELMKYVRIQ